MRYLIVIILMLSLGVVASSQTSPPDTPLTPQEWVKTMKYGSWWIFNIPPEKDNRIKIDNYSPAILDSLQSIGINGGRLHWQAKDMFNNNDMLNKKSLDFVEHMVDDFMERGMAICLQISFGSKDMGPKIKQRYYNGWRQVSERMSGKSHLLAMCPVIEFHGWEGYTYNGQPYTKKMMRDSLNWLYDTLTVIFRESNPTRIMSYKPWGAAKNAEFHTLSFPYGNDPAPDSGKPIYYIASFSGSYGMGHWDKWYKGMPADELQKLKEATVNAGRPVGKRVSGLNAAIQYRDKTGIQFWCDHWEPEYWAKTKRGAKAKKGGASIWTVEQNIAFTEFFMDTLVTSGSGGAGLQTRRFWNEETDDFFRAKPGMTKSEQLSVEMIKMFKNKAKENE